MKLFYDPRPFLAQHKRDAIKGLIADVIPDRDYYLLVIGAILLAASGIFLGSTPVLIASMLVAPLAQPILLLALGLAVRDGRVVLRAAVMLIVSTALAVLAAAAIYIAGRQLGHIEPDAILIGFIPNHFFDISIALIAGFVAVYGLIRAKVGSAMTGIGIAVSLLPPLVATGLWAAAGNAALSIDAFTIFGLNVAGILAASVATFMLFGFRREYRAMRSQ